MQPSRSFRGRLRVGLPVAAALGALVTASLLPGRAPAQDSADAQWEAMSGRFDGVWRLAVSTGAARRTVDRSIDEAVNAMNFFIRGMARPMIRDNTPVNEEIELRFRAGQNIFVRFDSRVRYTSRLGRTARVRTHTRDPMRLTQRFRGEQLEQVFQADNGTRWNTYTILGNGQMRVDAVTNGDMMPRAMRFSLSYRRQ